MRAINLMFRIVVLAKRKKNTSLTQRMRDIQSYMEFSLVQFPTQLEIIVFYFIYYLEPRKLNYLQ